MKIQPSLNYPLTALNSFGVPATAQAYLAINEVAQLEALRMDAQLQTMPRFVLGGGSNVILSEQVSGLVLHMCLQGRQLIAEDADFFYVRGAAGENWHEFVQWAIANGWFGLENLSLIPGTVGAAPVQNIGAYGLELQEYFFDLEAYDFARGVIVKLDKTACAFAYRDSIFKHAYKGSHLILNVTFALPKRWQPRLSYAELARHIQNLPAPTAQDIATAVISIRQAKLPDPKKLGNAGSFFKNPVVHVTQRNALLENFPSLVSYVVDDAHYKLAAGWLIDACGWKGKNLGQAGVYEKQALVLVNRGGATAHEVRNLAAAIQADVYAKFALELEIEPVFV